jgi:hypothetical protein
MLRTPIFDILRSVLHLAHDPFQRDDGLLRIGDDGRQQVRDAVIDESSSIFGSIMISGTSRASAVEQRQDHGVDRDRLARAGGAGDQQVRHLGEVGDDGSPPMVLPRQSGSCAFMSARNPRVEQSRR